MSRDVKSAIAILVAVMIVGAGLLISRGGGSSVELAAPSYIAERAPTGEVHEFRFVAGSMTGSLTPSTETTLWAYNGQVPGPEIRINLGDTVRVVLDNQLPEPTSIHWHGIRVPHAMDGVPGVTQPAVAPGETFTYEFTPPDAGTYWYHSHRRGNEQIARGLYGALVVENPDDPVYDHDVAWLVDDWRIDEQGVLDPDFDSSADIHHAGRWGDLLTVNGSTTTRLQVRPGERVRLRVANTANARILMPDFGDLQASVVAMDGLPVAETFPAVGVELAPGNRMDVDIAIPTDAAGELVIADGFLGIQPTEIARIIVAGDAVETRSFAPPTAEVADWSAARDQAPDHTVTISLYSEFAEASPEQADAILAGDEDGEFRWEFNGKAWPEPETLTTSEATLQKIRIFNDSGSYHPIHIHGQFFQLVALNDEPVNERHYRDTVIVNPFETIDIVVAAFDVGEWLLHCHIQLHAEYGMIMLYNVEAA